MLWRLKQFLTLWLRLFASGESTWGKIRKVIAALIFVGLLPFAFWNYSVPIYLQAPDASVALIVQVRLGLLLAIIATIVWMLISAGRAYELAGVPELTVANDLIADEVLQDQFFFRLVLTSRAQDFDTTVRLMEVLDANLNRMLPARFPIELEWSNHPDEISVHLTADVSESVSVALMRRKTIGDYELIYTAVHHKGTINLAVGERAYFHIRIEHRKGKPIERWFWFEKTSNSSFSFESCVDPRSELGR